MKNPSQREMSECTVKGPLIETTATLEDDR